MTAPVRVLHAVGQVATSVAEVAGDTLGLPVVALADAAELPARLPELEVLVGVALPVQDWAPATGLRLVQLAGSGTERFLPAPGLAPAVEIANARGVAAPAMAEFAVASLLTMAKRLPAAWAHQRARHWRRTAPTMLGGGQAVVVGAGPVGRGVATRLAALGMTVIGVRRSALASPEFDRVVGPDQLPDVLPTARAVVLAVASTPATRGLFDATLLGRCAPDCLLVNIGRGDVLDEPALVGLLRAGRLGGAALDVVATEPLPVDSELWATPGLLVTPHVSWYSPDYAHRVADLLVCNVRRLERGLEAHNRVDRILGY